MRPPAPVGDFWPESPSKEKGIYFMGEPNALSKAAHRKFKEVDTPWEFWSYDLLVRQAQAVSQLFAMPPLPAGGVVIISADTCPEAVIAFLGALWAGLKPVFVAPPQPFQSQREFADGLLRQSITLNAVCVVAGAKVCAALMSTACAVGRAIPVSRTRFLPLQVFLVPDSEGRNANPPAALIEFLQLTSGSTGPAKSVCIQAGPLVRHLQGIRSWLAWEERHGTASWLPLHHDMGLVGCLLMPFWMQSNLFLMRPTQFLRSPLHYLQCLGKGLAQLSAMPAFGLALAMRKVAASNLKHFDFSEWHALVVGAGTLNAAELSSFADWLKPHGFRAGALCPAYGLAEATLAVCGRRPGQGVASWAAVTKDDTGLWADLASSGSALPTVNVQVVNAEGSPCEDGVLGRIQVHACDLSHHGSGIGQCVEGDESGHSPIVAVLDTGDAGWLHQGELFVAGRFGDGVKLQGRWLFAEDVERSVTRNWPQLSGHCVALLGRIGQNDVAALLVDQRLATQVTKPEQLLRTWSADLRAGIYWVPAGLLQRTTSGKPMRRALWQELLNGLLDRYGHPPDELCDDRDEFSPQPTYGEISK